MGRVVEGCVFETVAQLVLVSLHKLRNVVRGIL